MKQIITPNHIMIIVVLALTLIGCRSTNEGQTAVDQPETIIITMAGSPGFQQAYETLAQQFRETHPTIQVQYLPLNQQMAGASLQERATLADVLLLDGRPSPEATALFLDLEPLATNDQRFNANDFWPGILSACQTGGVQTGLPLRANASLIQFDKAAFDAAGLAHPAPGWDWEDFRQVAQRLTQVEDGRVIRYGFLDSGRPLLLLGPLVDGLIIESDGRIDGQQLATELNWYIELAEQGAMPAYTGEMTVHGSQDSLINNRQAAMWPGGQLDLDQRRAAFGEYLGVAPFPAANQTASSNPISVACALVSAGTSRSQAAWDWLLFLTNQPPPQVGLLTGAPVRPSVADSSGYWAQMESATVGAIRYALEHGWYSRDSMTELAAVGEALRQALTGEMTLADGLPATVATQPTAPPPPDNTPVPVAAPQLTPTPAALPDNSISTDELIIVNYYAYSYYHSSQIALESLVRAFNEAQSSIEVRLDSAFGGSTIIDTANNYDCFAWGGWASSYASTYPEFSDKFYSLTPLMAVEEARLFEDFNTEQIAWSQFESELLALPVAVQPLVIRYNADLLASLGLDPPSPDWTVNEFWDLAIAAAANSEGGRRIYGFVPAILMPENLPLLFPEGAYPYDGYRSPPTGAFTEPAVIRGVNWLAGMVESGVMFPIDWGGTRTASIPRYASLQMQQQSGIVVRGEAALWVTQAGEGDYYFETGVAPFPQTNLLPLPSMYPQLTSLYISRRAANPLGCWEWIKFLSAQPNIFPGVPVRRSVMESPGWVAAVGNETAIAYGKALSQPMSTLPDLSDPYSEAVFPYRLWWSDALQEVFDGRPPADVLTEIQNRADVYLNCVMEMSSANLEQAINCARQADPEFQTVSSQGE